MPRSKLQRGSSARLREPHGVCQYLMNLGHWTYHSRSFQFPVSSGWSWPSWSLTTVNLFINLTIWCTHVFQLGAPTNLCWELCTKTDARRQLPGCWVRGPPSHQPQYALDLGTRSRYWLHKSCKIEFYIPTYKTAWYSSARALMNMDLLVAACSGTLLIKTHYLCILRAYRVGNTQESECVSFLRSCVSSRN